MFTLKSQVDFPSRLLNGCKAAVSNPHYGMSVDRQEARCLSESWYVMHYLRNDRFIAAPQAARNPCVRTCRFEQPSCTLAYPSIFYITLLVLCVVVDPRYPAETQQTRKFFSRIPIPHPTLTTQKRARRGYPLGQNGNQSDGSKLRSYLCFVGILICNTNDANTCCWVLRTVTHSNTASALHLEIRTILRI